MFVAFACRQVSIPTKPKKFWQYVSLSCLSIERYMSKCIDFKPCFDNISFSYKVQLHLVDNKTFLNHVSDAIELFADQFYGIVSIIRIGIIVSTHWLMVESSFLLSSNFCRSDVKVARNYYWIYTSREAFV